QAATQAWHPVQRSKSIAIPHLCCFSGSVLAGSFTCTPMVLARDRSEKIGPVPAAFCPDARAERALRQTQANPSNSPRLAQESKADSLPCRMHSGHTVYVLRQSPC